MTSFIASVDLTSAVVTVAAIYVMASIEDYCTRVCRQWREDREADKRIARW